MTFIEQLWSLFNRRERWQLGILSVAVTIRAGVEMIGVASIMPFMSVVADPDMVQRNPYLRATHEWFGFSTETAFLTALGAMVVLLLAIANSVSALTHYALMRFCWGMHHRLSMRLLGGYLGRPYSFFTQRNSASLNKTLLSEVQTVVNGVMRPALDIGARVLMIAALLGLLILVDPLLAAVVACVLGGGYGAAYLIIKRKQRALGHDRVSANRQRFKVSGEAFGGIKDVKVLQREQALLSQFKPASWRYSKATASNAVISQLPRYLLETIAFGGIVLIVLYFLQEGGGVAQILPVISLYAFAGYRLMPELQKLFADAAGIRFSRAALDDFMHDYCQLPERARRTCAELGFEKCIRFENVTFSYEGSTGFALQNLNLCLERNHTYGLVGSSGAGKTTVVDLLLGLYEPHSGRICIDDVGLAPHVVPAWRQQIGYVPQHIFLTDDTIAANIAFGVPATNVDARLLERAARIAKLHDFIITLPQAYDTVVGERGVRLSGGQRQRIGIARALYHDPSVLIMDEATSALDGATEDAVMEALRELVGKKTIVIIAHRLSTVRSCDCIFMLEHGRLYDSGDYATLLDRNPLFRAMSGARGPSATAPQVAGELAPGSIRAGRIS